jgi:hypothetical protein
MVMAINWDLYNDRLEINGSTARERNISKIKDTISSKIIGSPSYQSVTINVTSKNLIIGELSSTTKDLTKKQILSLPDESFNLGDLIVWDSNNWLVTNCDFDETIQCKGIIEQCNYTLKFQNTLGTILSYPVIFESKTSPTLNEGQYLTTVESKSTIKLRFDQENINDLFVGKRLMIDSRTNTLIPNVYIVSDVILSSYDGGTTGILILMLEKDKFDSSKDSLVNWIADFENVVVSTGSAEINYSGDCIIRVGGSYKTLTAVFKDENDNILNLTPIWSYVSSITGAESNFTTIIDNTTKTIKIKCADITSLIGSTLTLSLTESTGVYSASLIINVISL